MALNPKFEIIKGKDGQYYFHLKAGNGQIILQSEGYTNKQGAVNGINSIKSSINNASAYDLTGER